MFFFGFAIPFPWILLNKFSNMTYKCPFALLRRIYKNVSDII